MSKVLEMIRNVEETDLEVLKGIVSFKCRYPQIEAIDIIMANIEVPEIAHEVIFCSSTILSEINTYLEVSELSAEVEQQLMFHFDFDEDMALISIYFNKLTGAQATIPLELRKEIDAIVNPLGVITEQSNPMSTALDGDLAVTTEEVPYINLRAVEQESIDIALNKLKTILDEYKASI